MALVLRKAVMPKNVSLFKCIKGRNLATAANKQNPAVLTKCGTKTAKMPRSWLVTSPLPLPMKELRQPADMAASSIRKITRSVSCPLLRGTTYHKKPSELRQTNSATTCRDFNNCRFNIPASYFCPSTFTNYFTSSPAKCLQNCYPRLMRMLRYNPYKYAVNAGQRKAVGGLSDVAKCVACPGPKCPVPCGCGPCGCGRCGCGPCCGPCGRFGCCGCGPCGCGPCGCCGCGPCGCGPCGCGPCGCCGPCGGCCGPCGGCCGPCGGCCGPCGGCCGCCGCCPVIGSTAAGRCLPPPSNCCPKCIQYMTGYYHYPYGFWFCGPYHVKACCPVACGCGPCGPCGACGPCGPCGPRCACCSCLTSDIASLLANSPYKTALAKKLALPTTVQYRTEIPKAYELENDERNDPCAENDEGHYPSAENNESNHPYAEKYERNYPYGENYKINNPHSYAENYERNNPCHPYTEKYERHCPYAENYDRNNPSHAFNLAAIVEPFAEINALSLYASRQMDNAQTSSPESYPEQSSAYDEENSSELPYSNTRPFHYEDTDTPCYGRNSFGCSGPCICGNGPCSYCNLCGCPTCVSPCDRCSPPYGFRPGPRNPSNYRPNRCSKSIALRHHSSIPMRRLCTVNSGYSLENQRPNVLRSMASNRNGNPHYGRMRFYANQKRYSCTSVAPEELPVPAEALIEDDWMQEGRDQQKCQKTPKSKQPLPYSNSAY